MKHDGKDCCEDKAPAAPDGHDAGNGDHHPAPPAD
jgi:hypothetical protein